jgi:predicted SAM-dependent methyltransferase
MKELAIDIGCGDKSTVPAALREVYEWRFLDKYDFSKYYPPMTFSQHDLKDILPFASNSVSFIYMHHVAEHLPPRHPTKDIDFLVWVVNEFHRVLRVGGEAHIIVPWIRHPNALRCPTHYRCYIGETFKWFGYWEHMTPELLAEGVIPEWKVTRAEVVDNCHVYSILQKLL